MIAEVSSFPNFSSAFARVEASRGMPGVDGMTLSAF